MNVANQLTMLRIALALAVFAALMQPGPRPHIAAFLLFVAAVITDWVDGAVARMTQTVSAFGKVADPIADKILVTGALIGLSKARIGVPLWAVFLIIARELLIGGMRIITTSQGRVPAAERWGKWKMGVQSGCVLTILLLLVLRERWSGLPQWTEPVPYALSVLCVLAAWGSAYRYFHKSRRALEKSWS